MDLIKTEEEYSAYCCPDEANTESSVRDYCNKMEKLGEYGDQLTLKTMTQLLGKNILVLQHNDEQLSVHLEGTHPFNLSETMILYFDGLKQHYDTFSSRPNDAFESFLSARLESGSSFVCN